MAAADVRGLTAPLTLVAAPTRRRPRRWFLPALGIAVAAAFAGSVAVAGTVAGDVSARAQLAGLSPLERNVRVTWQGVVTEGTARQARKLLSGLGLGAPTEIVLLNPVRLSGVVVRLAAIAPLNRWLASDAAGRLGRCRAASCPTLLAGRGAVPSQLSANGVLVRVVGSAPLSSAVPLGFSPSSSDEPPLLVTSDAAGLEKLAGLSGVYRTHSWLAQLTTARLHSWQLAAVEAHLGRSQADLLASGSQFSLSGPFSGLDAARAQASAAPRRLLLAGGGAVAALAVFVILAAGGLRRDQIAELERLRNAGARAGQAALFVAAEAGWLCGTALVAGAALAIVAATVIASATGDPVGGVLAHSLITPTAAAALVGAWLATTALVALSAVARTGRVVEALAIAAVAALVAGVSVSAGGDDQLAVLIAPLCCLGAGLLTFRATAPLLRAGERLARRGPVLARIAFVGLARAPTFPSLAVAFIAISVGFGGFALAYRATLIRGATDQAADRVPLDAIVAPGADFRTPLALASSARWQAIANGRVLAVRRTEASYARGGETATVPALGVPADGLSLIHGWRTSDGSAPLTTLAGRLQPSGPTRTPGPELPVTARWLSLRARSPALEVSVTADLRDQEGAIRQLPLGVAGARSTFLRARLPRGRWELQALELDEPTGLEITNGHQNGENPGAATQFQAPVALGPIMALRGAGRPTLDVPLGAWRAVGAATSNSPATAGAETVVRFATSGAPGVVRPRQPSDTHPVPVLVDPQTATSAGRGGRLELTVGNLPVPARVVGVLRRFPTLARDAAGVVVADQPTLSGALDAQLPGQGRVDELWLSTGQPARLRAALRSRPFAGLSSLFRGDIEHQLRAAPIARGVLDTLVAATALSAALAVLGLLWALLGPSRDTRFERDLEAQGMGPRALRAELRMRLLLASALGVCAGLGIAVVMTRLAVAAVRGAATVAVPRPSLVTVVPWLQLGAWGVTVIAALAVASWLATRSLMRTRRTHLPSSAPVSETATLGEGVAG